MEECLGVNGRQPDEARLNGGMFGCEWEAAACSSGLQFRRVRKCVVGAMFYYYYTTHFMAHHAVSAMD